MNDCISGSADDSLAASLWHSPKRVRLRDGEHLVGIVQDRKCQLAHTTLCESLMCSKVCPVASFSVRLSGPALLLPRVQPVWGSSGQYKLHAYPGLPGVYNLSVWLEYGGSDARCGCVNASMVPMVPITHATVVVHGDADLRAKAAQLHHGAGSWARIDCTQAMSNSNVTDLVCNRLLRDVCVRANRVGVEPHQALDLLQMDGDQTWLYLPHQCHHAGPSSEAYRRGPLDFVRGIYWLHFEGDSIMLRGEKEELMWFMNGANATAVVLQRVTCIDVMRGKVKHRRAVCGDAGENKGILRNDWANVALYTWQLDTGTLFASFSPAGGTGGRWELKPMRTKAAARIGECQNNRSLCEPRCANTYGVGTAYWRELFRLVGPIVGAVQPHAVVLNYAAHFLGPAHECSASGTYTSHLDHWFRSLRSVYKGEVVWRTASMTHGSTSACTARLPVYELHEKAISVAQLHGLHTLDTMSISEAWPTATCDHLHYDGGWLRAKFHQAKEDIACRDQRVSTTVLNVLLNLLSALHGRDGGLAARAAQRTPGPRDPCTVRHRTVAIGSHNP